MKRMLLILIVLNSALGVVALWSYKNIYQPSAAMPVITFRNGVVPTDRQRAEIYRQWRAQINALETSKRNGGNK